MLPRSTLRKRTERCLLAAAHRGDAAWLTNLLIRGANPNSRTDPMRRTALVRAVAAGHHECARLLIVAGARVDESWGSQSRTALLVSAEKGDPDLVRLLIQGGAQIDGATDYCRTPLMEAVFHGSTEIVRIMLAAGADPLYRSRGNWTGRNALELARYRLLRMEQAARLLEGEESKRRTAALRQERQARAVLECIEKQLSRAVPT